MSTDSESPGKCLRTSENCETGLSSLSQSLNSDSYFGDDMYDSPDSGSSDTEDVLSDATFEDSESLDFGYPLQRMPKHAGNTPSLDIHQRISVLLKVSPCSSHLSSRSVSSGSSMSVNHEDVGYEEIIDEMLHQKSNPFLLQDSKNLVAFDPGPTSKFNHPSGHGPWLMIKQLTRSSQELLMLLELNHPDSREDTWNHVPYILSAVERNDRVYLCIQGLCKYDDPPLTTVAQYIDFFRQVLEGLTFLHEQRIAGFNCSDPSSFMIDLASAPRMTPMSLPRFDRTVFPVRYYFVNFSKASRVHGASVGTLSPASLPEGEARGRAASPFQKDIQECGALFDRLLQNVPQISQKFKSLTTGMINNNFTADDSRRLFEALCRSLDANVFESGAAPHTLLERAHTVSHLVSTPVMSSNLEKVLSH